MPRTFLYFAYGSNMLLRRLSARTRSAMRIGTGFVEGRKLTFDKVSTEGAIENALPDAYIDVIRAVPSQTDSDAFRRARNEALLAGIFQ